MPQATRRSAQHRRHRDFTFVQPRVVTHAQRASTSLRVRCTYHKPKATPVHGGLGSDDAICFNIALLAVRPRLTGDDR